MSSFSITNSSHLPLVRDHERLQKLDQCGELSFHRSASSGEPEVASRDNRTPAGPLRYLPETPPGHSTPCTDPNCLQPECLSDLDCSCLKLTPTLDDAPQHPSTSPHDERTSTPQQVEFRREGFARSRDACPYNCICICHFFLEDHWQRAEAHAQLFDGADPDLVIIDRQAPTRQDMEEYVNNEADGDSLAATLGSSQPNLEPPWHWDDSLYKCAICTQQPPVDPRHIPRCTHLFCKECLGDSVAATILQGVFPVFCPVCQEQAQGGDTNLVPLSESAFEELGVDPEVREVFDRAARERRRG